MKVEMLTRNNVFEELTKSISQQILDGFTR